MNLKDKLKNSFKNNKEILKSTFCFAFVSFIIAMVLALVSSPINLSKAYLSIKLLSMMIFPIKTKFEIVSLVIITIVHTIIKKERMSIKNILFIALFIYFLHWLTYIIPSIISVVLIHKLDTIRFLLFDGSPFIPRIIKVIIYFTIVRFIYTFVTIVIINIAVVGFMQLNIASKLKIKKIFDGKKKTIIAIFGVFLIIALIFYNVWWNDYKNGLITENVITQPAGHLIDARSDHHAVLLNDDRIYIVGGDHKTNKSAEIYDPKTKISTKVADLPEPLLKQEYSVTVLKNGKVLIAGGRHDNDAIKRAYIYDPYKDIFEPAISMTGTHAEHKAVLLKNGNVLITGGNHSGIIDIYNSKANKFSSLGKYCSPSEMKNAKHFALDRQDIVLLNENKVLVVGGGGCDRNDDYSAQAKIINPKSNKVSTTASLHVNRGYPTVTLLKDGRVLVSGGTNIPEKYIQDLEIYNSKKNIFINAGKTDVRGGYTTTLLPNGEILFAGGCAGYGAAGYGIGSIYVYNPTTYSYTFLGNMKRKRAGHTATVLKDGSIIFIGGTGHKEIEVYKPTGKE